MNYGVAGEQLPDSPSGNSTTDLDRVISYAKGLLAETAQTRQQSVNSTVINAGCIVCCQSIPPKGRR